MAPRCRNSPRYACGRPAVRTRRPVPSWKARCVPSNDADQGEAAPRGCMGSFQSLAFSKSTSAWAQAFPTAAQATVSVKRRIAGTTSHLLCFPMGWGPLLN